MPVSLSILSLRFSLAPYKLYGTYENLKLKMLSETGTWFYCCCLCVFVAVEFKIFHKHSKKMCKLVFISVLQQIFRKKKFYRNVPGVVLYQALEFVKILSLLNCRGMQKSKFSRKHLLSHKVVVVFCFTSTVNRYGHVEAVN